MTHGVQNETVPAKIQQVYEEMLVRVYFNMQCQSTGCFQNPLFNSINDVIESSTNGLAHATNP